MMLILMEVKYLSNVTISILMPVYNSQEYLKNTVQGVINQSYKEWELILVDDGSKDNSKNICIELQKIDNRIRFVNKENTGVSDTRNIALDNAKGKYIAFIDSDDSVHKDYLKILLSSIEKSNGQLAVCGFKERKISTNGQIEELSRVFYPKEVIATEDMKDLIMDFGNSGLLNPLWNKLYSREIIEKNNIRFKEEVETGEDFIFNLQYFRKINNICFSKGELYYYIRRNNNSITYQYIDNMYEKGLEIHNLLEDFLKDMNFYNSKNKYILYGNHLMGVFSAFLNLFHKDCKLTLKQKKHYIKAIVNREYVSECAVNRKRDKGLIGLTALLVRIKNSTIICSVFKGISLVRLVKS